MTKETAYGHGRTHFDSKSGPDRDGNARSIYRDSLA
jgi:hypothetical protein